MTQSIGERIRRNEDPRLLTGQALFVDDVDIPGMVHAAFKRSDYAHARILGIDVSRAKSRPGVVAVFTAADMGDDWSPGPPLVSPPPTVKDVTFHSRRQVPLVKDVVRLAGEAIAVVIAESRYIAEDAVDEILVDYEPLPVITDLEQAIAPGSPLVHDDLDSNLAAHFYQQKGNYEQVREKADLVIKRRFHLDRGAALAMENRGIVASWDNKSKMMTIWDTTQAPIPIRNGTAARLGLSDNQVRVIAPFIGGAFGPKIMMFYPEEMVLPWASRKLNLPIKWIEDRRENFYATTAERQQLHDVEMAFTRDGHILGLKDDFLHDTGAYDPYGLTIPLNTQSHLMGAYKIDHFSSNCTAVFTNRQIVTPVRGAGRQQGIYIIERMMDIASRELNIDPVELRRKNFIPADAFPYHQVIIDQAFSELIFDSGNYQVVLDKALQKIDYERFIKEEQPRLRAEGKHVGIAVTPFIETTGVGPYEGARVQIETSGKVNVSTGYGTQGQGHFTTLAQIVSEQLNVPVKDIRIVTGDTAEFHWGTGSFASRGMVVAGNAVHAAAVAVRGKVLKNASQELATPVDQLELVDGLVRKIGSPETFITLGDLAARANPLRGAVQPGTEPGLEATDYYGPSFGATASGCHAMILEVDPDTMMVKIRRYVVVEDCGRVINPLVVEGQVHGGVSMGLGNAYYEKLDYDENGQILNASLADYLVVTPFEMPQVIEVDHFETLSPLNKLGTKGVGEAGAIPVPALFTNALTDALQDFHLDICETPLSPSRLFELIQGAKTQTTK